MFQIFRTSFRKEASFSSKNFDNLRLKLHRSQQMFSHTSKQKLPDREI